jgi:hypothetical protein
MKVDWEAIWVLVLGVLVFGILLYGAFMGQNEAILIPTGN